MHKTSDYSKFNLLPYNRDICRKHVDILKQKILCCNELESNPIQVTKDFEIINGQHRFTAAQELRLPFFYVIIEPFAPESLLHSNFAKAWTIENYIKFYAVRGSNEHQKIIDYSAKNNLSLAQCFTLLTGSARSFNVPTAKIEPYRLEVLDLTLKTINYLLINIDPYEKKPISVINTSKFIQSLFSLLFKGVVDVERLSEQLVKFHYKITGRGKVSEFFTLFSEIYNHGLKNRVEF